MRMIPDCLAVNGTVQTVMQLPIQLGKYIGIEDTHFEDVPNHGCGLYYVSNDKLLSGLVLGYAPGTVGATYRLHMASASFGRTVIPSFLGHLGDKDPRE